MDSTYNRRGERSSNTRPVIPSAGVLVASVAIAAVAIGGGVGILRHTETAAPLAPAASGTETRASHVVSLTSVQAAQISAHAIGEALPATATSSG